MIDRSGALADPYAIAWPLREENGTLEAHEWNVGPIYERERRRLITAVALSADRSDREAAKSWSYGLSVHRTVTARREEREFYRRVPLTTEDRMLVYARCITPIAFRQIADALSDRMSRRQVRRALQSIVSMGLVRDEVQTISRGRSARVYRQGAG